MTLKNDDDSEKIRETRKKGRETKREIKKLQIR